MCVWARVRLGVTRPLKVTFELVMCTDGDERRDPDCDEVSRALVTVFAERDFETTSIDAVEEELTSRSGQHNTPVL